MVELLPVGLAVAAIVARVFMFVPRKRNKQ
jgi:hypothetical protein